MRMSDENLRPGAYEIPSHVLVEWLWRTVTLPKIQRDAAQAKARTTNGTR